MYADSYRGSLIQVPDNGLCDLHRRSDRAHLSCSALSRHYPTQYTGFSARSYWQHKASEPCSPDKWGSDRHRPENIGLGAGRSEATTRPMFSACLGFDGPGRQPQTANEVRSKKSAAGCRVMLLDDQSSRRSG
jgi:hypothetical protein